MSDCSLDSANYFGLAQMFIKDRDYSKLAKAIYDTSLTGGYFYNIQETIDKINKELIEVGQNPTSSSLLTSTFTDYVSSHKRLALTKNSFFDKDLVDLYVNGDEIMQYMKNQLNDALIKAAFIDTRAKKLEAKITIGDGQLNTKIQEYKNNLLKTIYDYLLEDDRFNMKYTNLKFEPLYNDDGSFNVNTIYFKILEDFESVFKDFSLKNISIYKESNLVQLDVYNAGIILSKFDDLVERNFKSILSVNQSNLGAITNPIGNFQYFLEFKGIKANH
jgi:hypothetical protein